MGFFFHCGSMFGCSTLTVDPGIDPMLLMLDICAVGGSSGFLKGDFSVEKERHRQLIHVFNVLLAGLQTVSFWGIKNNR